METFSELLAVCEGNPPVTGGFPSQRPVSQSFDVFFDLRLSKRLNKQSRRSWFETASHSLWRHCNDTFWSRRFNIMQLKAKYTFRRIASENRYWNGLSIELKAQRRR